MHRKTLLQSLAAILIVGLVTPCTWANDDDDVEENKQKTSFEDVEIGTVPPEAKVEATRQVGRLATWKVIEDSSAPDGTKVLALTSPNHDSRGTFNLCWTDSVSFKDGEIELEFKANSGEVDQGGGPIWRAKDKDNYYICRANPLEDNFRLYYVKNGSRSQIATADVAISSGKWHTIKVVHRGTHIECYFNGKKLIDVTDDTFSESGGVGLWTKADAVTSFDNILITF